MQRQQMETDLNVLLDNLLTLLNIVKNRELEKVIGRVMLKRAWSSILRLLYERADSVEKCLTIRELSEIANMSKQTVERAIASLEELKLVKTKFVLSKNFNGYVKCIYVDKNELVKRVRQLIREILEKTETGRKILEICRSIQCERWEMGEEI